MKLLEYCLCFPIIFCGCANATPNEKIPELACPYVLPAEKDFPTGWVTLRKIPIGKLQLRETEIISGNAKDNGVRPATVSQPPKTHQNALSFAVVN